jgi:hypothetical protein
MSKKIAIMQPYFFPYIGYFQLINAVDEFIIYDNIKYTKKGWINRNRILSNGKDSLITLPIKKDSDFLDVVDRELPENWERERTNIINQIVNSYRKSPHFDTAFDIIEKSMLCSKTNLFEFIHYGLLQINDYIGIKTKIIKSSDVPIDHSLKSKDKVIEICKNRNASVYINPIGGTGLYQKEEFKNSNIDLYFIKSNPILYSQFSDNFIPWLSIIDIIMFNSKDEIQNHLKDFSLI